MKSTFISIDGLRLRYLYAGQGPALVLIHPIGHSGDVFFRNIDALAEAYTVIAPDLPGHGFSDPIDFRSSSPQAATSQLFASMLASLGHEHYSLIGSSYGALVATLGYFHYPDRVENLILIGSGSVFHSPEGQTAILADVRANALTAMRDPTLEACRRRLQNICFEPSSVAEEILLTQITYYGLHDRFSNYLATIDGLIVSTAQHEHQVFHRLEQIVVPTLVLVGREDIRARWQLHEEGARRIPHASYVAFSECGHLPYMEHADLFNRTVSAFLSRSEGFNSR